MYKNNINGIEKYPRISVEIIDNIIKKYLQLFSLLNFKFLNFNEMSLILEFNKKLDVKTINIRKI